MSQEVLRQIIDLTSKIVAEGECELIDAEIVFEAGRQILRLYIDKQGGIQLKDCSRVSHLVEDLLEVEGIILGRYSLEVSSPGENRRLRLPAHFKTVLGQTVSVVTKDKINDRKRFKGILQQVTDKDLVIEIDNKDYNVPLDQLAKANLVNKK